MTLTADPITACKVCEKSFFRFRSLQQVCSSACAAKVPKIARNAAVADRRETRAKLEALKPLRKLRKEAQDAFNAFIRARDAALPCICCGNWPDSDDWKPGGTWDAGHFLSRGAHPELRFTEDNCHRQLKTCNAGSSKYAMKGRTVAQGYREGLIARIGLARVEALEGPHPQQHYTVDDLRAIKAKYRAMARELTKEAA